MEEDQKSLFATTMRHELTDSTLMKLGYGAAGIVVFGIVFAWVLSKF